ACVQVRLGRIYGQAEPVAQLDGGRHSGFARHEALAAAPASDLGRWGYHRPSQHLNGLSGAPQPGRTQAVATAQAALRNMREICLSLPGTAETVHFGESCFRVGKKIFASCGEKTGVYRLVFQLEPQRASWLVDSDPDSSATHGRRTASRWTPL